MNKQVYNPIFEPPPEPGHFMENLLFLYLLILYFKERGNT
jgi:hypothetical protein